MPDNKKTISILYVDDDALNLRLVRKNLQSMGYTVFEALDGQTGIQLARQKQPDVILMDLHMPGLSGWEAIQQLREDPKTREIPITVLTADLSDTVRGELLQSVDAYLTKPISRSKLLKVVRHLTHQLQTALL